MKARLDAPKPEERTTAWYNQEREFELSFKDIKTKKDKYKHLP